MCFYERAKQARGKEKVCGVTVLLVDDVFTTGATAKYCAKALRQSGARRIFFAAYALGGSGKR